MTHITTTGIIMQEASPKELELMSEIEHMLDTMKWPNRLTRTKIGTHPDRKAFVLGKAFQYDRATELVESRFNVMYPELHAALKRLMRLHDPGFRFNCIQLNANVECEPHLDFNNCGMSYGLALGKFTGGGIVLYPNAKSKADANDPEKMKGALPYRNKRRWVYYNGATTLHASLPVTSGTRYALIFFDRRRPCVRSSPKKRKKTWSHRKKRSNQRWRSRH